MFYDAVQLVQGSESSDSIAQLALQNPWESGLDRMPTRNQSLTSLTCTSYAEVQASGIRECDRRLWLNYIATWRGTHRIGRAPFRKIDLAFTR